MKSRKVISILIWVVVLIQIIPVAFTNPLDQLPNLPPDTSDMYWACLLFPAFFGGGAFILRRFPFDILLIRQIVDKKFGDGAYANFIIELKPMLLSCVAAFSTSLATLYSCYHFKIPDHFFLPEFMASAGVSFLLVRIILQKRGLLMEAPSAQSISIGVPSGSREFVPLFIREIKPTNKTALLAGVWTAVGMTAIDAVAQSGMVTFGGSIIFFIIPVVLFVFGYQYIPDIKERETTLAWYVRRTKESMGRLLHWFLGATLIIPIVMVVKIVRLFTS